MRRERWRTVAVIFGCLVLGGVAPPTAWADVANAFAGQDGQSVYVKVQGSGSSTSSTTSGGSGTGTVKTIKRILPFGATENHPNFTAWQQATHDACLENASIMTCFAQFDDMLTPLPGTPATAPSRADVQEAARQAMLSMNLPLPTPRIGPDPLANEWDMAVVGFPLWLWVDGPRSMSAVNRDFGAPITLSATLSRVNFAMGDGTTVTCHDFAPYPASIAPGTPSLTCGYRYQRPSLPTGSYTVVGTAVWNVRWSALGYSGTFVADLDDSRALPVGELQTVIVG